MDVASATASLDVGTLFVIAIFVASLLGVFLLSAWTQERSRALAWWGAAYLIGGASGAVWRFGRLVAPALPAGLATILLFVAVGMIWSAARLFYGRPVSWIGTLFGAAIWLIVCFVPNFALSAASRVVISSLIVAGYTFLTAIELRRERRKLLKRRWPAVFVPMLHGAIFLFPAALATLAPDAGGIHSLARVWIAVFAIEIVLYVVGTAFIVLVLAKDRTVHFYKTAATTDPLTGVLNRRGFFEAAALLMGRCRKSKTPVSVLAFDLDHFKSINDRYGHAVGDAVLQSFARVVGETMRAGDLIGRLGGEEFIALLSGVLADAAAAGERVRSAFAATSTVRDDQHIAATVSIGVACGSPLVAIDTLIARADTALYRAKELGRNRVEGGDDAVLEAAEPRHGLTTVRSTQREKKSSDDAAALEAAEPRRGRAFERSAEREKEKDAANDDALGSCIA
jgi:diguanylate cyclase (GGDEF)-like protein